MIKYVFRENEPLRIKAAGKADPQKIGEALSVISEDNFGRLTPQSVVEAARDKGNPLHPHFEWDDGIAAQHYRLEQARSVIRVVRVVDEDTTDGTGRAFLSLNDGNGVAYRHVTEVKSSADLQLAVLNRAEQDLIAFESRYKELTEVCDLVGAARQKVVQRRREFETREAA